MKAACILIACCSVSSVDAHLPKGFNILAALHHKGGHKKHTKKELAKNDPMGIMGSIMAAAQQGMAVAEKHHGQVVQEARTNMSSLFEKEVKALSQGISSFHSDLASASFGVERAINASNVVLAKVVKEPPKANSWDSTAAMAHATLNAQKDTAQSMMEKADRQGKRKVNEAVSDASQILEDGVGKLSLKVGDVTELVSKAKSNLEKMTDVAGVDGKASSFAQKSGATADMSNAAALMMSAQKQAIADRAAAKKRLDVVFEQVAKDMSVGEKSIEDGLQAAEKVEINELHGAAVVAAPVQSKPALRHGNNKK